MSVHSRPSMKYQDGMELRDRKMKKDCTQPLRIGNIRALNGCAGRLLGPPHCTTTITLLIKVIEKQ